MELREEDAIILVVQGKQIIVERLVSELLREKLKSSVFLLESTILTKKVQIYGNFSTP